MNKKLLLSLLLLPLCITTAIAQSKNPEPEGDDAMKAGYYKSAYDYYTQAYAQNPDNIPLLYKIADACRLSNDYEGAIRYYTAVLQSNTARQYVDCHYQLARMYKNNGQPDSAQVHFETYLRTLPANEEYAERARQELRACQWLLESDKKELQRYYVQHESKNVNTAASESGALLVGVPSTYLLFSTVADPNDDSQDPNLALMQTYQAELADHNKPGLPVLNEWGINSKRMHSGNVAYEPVHQILFFTRCDGDDFSDISCDIYYMRWNGKRFSRAEKLGGDVNLAGYSSTQPAAGLLPDSSIILYFSSNRPEGVGGFDIWYTRLNQKMEPSPCVNLGYPVNTRGNEITPFYSNEEQRLYFSSDWHYGYGGYDVFFSEGNRDAWDAPVNLGSSLNSSANDIYFNQNYNDPYKGYLTSNRRGSFYIHDNTCCNDIYSWSSEPVTPEPPKKECDCQKRSELIRPMLPIALYFDNDRPNPKSKSPYTTLNYFQTYNTYMFRRSEYKAAHFRNPYINVDSICRTIDRFFDGDVEYNCKKFETFLNLLGQDLKNGRRISLTIEGYASPLHDSGYNFNLSKRRIATIINQIMEYNQGELLRYMGREGEGSLQLREVAYGSSRAAAGVSDSRADHAASIYSVEAARERRIEIQDYQYMEDDSTIISCLHAPSRAYHIGVFNTGEVKDVEIHLPHTAAMTKQLAYIQAGTSEATVTGYSPLRPAQDLVIYLRVDTRHMSPTYAAFIPLTLRVDGEAVTQTFFLEYSVIKK